MNNIAKRLVDDSIKDYQDGILTYELLIHVILNLYKKKAPQKDAQQQLDINTILDKMQYVTIDELYHKTPSSLRDRPVFDIDGNILTKFSYKNDYCSVHLDFTDIGDQYINFCLWEINQSYINREIDDNEREKLIQEVYE